MVCYRRRLVITVVLIITTIFVSELALSHNFSSILKTEDPDDNVLVFPSLESYVERYRSNTTENFVFNDISGKDLYLRMYHTLYNIREPGKETPETKQRLENNIRSGYGLKPYVTERNEIGWIENGIVYRPWRKPAPKAVEKKFPTPFSADYEVYVPFNETAFFEGRPPPSGYKVNKKLIAWHTVTRYAPPMDPPGPMTSCPEFPCLITTNKKHAANAAGVLFTAQLVKGKPPVRKNPNQVFVFHNHEPPFQNRYWDTDVIHKEWKSVFNWTMTFRMDSDIVVPYGIVRRRPQPILNKDYESLVSEKTKLVAWIVSNCISTAKRDLYFKELKKYIDIDVYGECGRGKLKCAHSDAEKCASMITKKYKFYLAFESSYCTDYVSEKFFHYLNTDTIIVARGSNDFFQHAPSEIFLNTADFPSPKKLAERMKYLDQNTEAYIAMLKEKDKYTAIMEGYPVRRKDGSIRFMGFRFETLGLCHLCQRLWNMESYRKSVPDVAYWLREQKKCYRPSDLKV